MSVCSLYIHLVGVACKSFIYIYIKTYNLQRSKVPTKFKKYQSYHHKQKSQISDISSSPHKYHSRWYSSNIHVFFNYQSGRSLVTWPRLGIPDAKGVTRVVWICHCLYVFLFSVMIIHCELAICSTVFTVNYGHILSL